MKFLDILTLDIKLNLSLLWDQLWLPGNDSATRWAVGLEATKYLDGLVFNSEIHDYKIVCDSMNNTQTDIDNDVINVDLYIKPKASVSFITFKSAIHAKDDLVMGRKVKCRNRI